MAHDRDNDEPPIAFSYRSEVFFDELDAWHMLHNARYGVHVERAGLAWHLELAANAYGADADGDQFVVMREFHIEFSKPLREPGAMSVDLWIRRIGRTSVTTGFRCRGHQTDSVHATGYRTLVKLDRETLTSAPWSDSLRKALELQKHHNSA